MNDTQNTLLPSGFSDLLPPHAGVEADAVHVLMARFKTFGYERVKPPLMEFEDSLFAEGPGKVMANSSFRLMDPTSHKMMGVRPDITVQVSRIARTFLREEGRPVRLTYAGDVVQTKATQQRTARQFCQVGCELIGMGGVQADIEACVIAVHGVLDLGLRDLTLDISYPPLVRKVLAQYDGGEAMAQALANRDMDVLPQELCDLMMSDDVFAALRVIDADIAGYLQALYEGVQSALVDLGVSEFVNVTLDPLEMQGFDYKSGMAFTLFTAETSGELGRGGRYELGEGGGEGGVGFTLYMDTLRQLIPPAQTAETVTVPSSTSWAEIARLQKGGKVVIRSNDKE